MCPAPEAKIAWLPASTSCIELAQRQQAVPVMDSVLEGFRRILREKVR